MHFSRSDHEHSFLGLCLFATQAFSHSLWGNKERGATRRKETLSHRKPSFQWTGSLLFVAPVARRVEPEGPVIFLSFNCFPFPHQLLTCAVRIQLLRLVAELACSCPALVAILPPLYVLIIWNRAAYELEGLEQGLGTVGSKQQGMVTTSCLSTAVCKGRGRSRI